MSDVSDVSRSSRCEFMQYHVRHQYFTWRGEPRSCDGLLPPPTPAGSAPICGCPTDTGTGGDGDRGNVGSLGTPPVPGLT